MGSFFDILQTAYATAYSHGLKKKYTEPKIYHGGKDYDLTKRWYVYFSFQHPSKRDKHGNPVLQRQTPVTFKVNQRYKTKRERMFHLELIRETLSEMLKNGYSPYENDTDSGGSSYTVDAALDFALSLKEKTTRKSTVSDYSTRISKFKKFLEGRGMLKANIREIDKRLINEYLNLVLSKSGARNRNNTRSVLSALFTVLEDNEIIDRNFIHNIKKLRAESKKNKAYKFELVEDLYKFIEKRDEQLLFFIKLVSYNFLRPIEACRIQVKDINLEQRTFYFQAKNKKGKTKIIPEVIFDELQKLELTHPDDYLVTPHGVGPWDTEETNKRDFFSKQFKKIKDAYNNELALRGESFRLGKDHTIYSFRHTFITKLYRELREKYTPTETYDKLMLITGHSTLMALKQYLREIDAELPDDYSNLLK